MSVKSLDPRITRLNIALDADNFVQPKPMDQLETYQVFTQVREGKPYGHVGIMHAADEMLAFLEAKEQYGRRGKCFGVWVAKTANVHHSVYADLGKNIFEHVTDVKNEGDNTLSYDVFLQARRGKQHEFLCTVKASTPEGAFYEAKQLHGNTHNGCNLWAIPTKNLLKTTEEDKVIFATAPEKQFREPLMYKIKDRIDAYRIKNNMN